MSICMLAFGATVNVDIEPYIVVIIAMIIPIIYWILNGQWARPSLNQQFDKEKILCLCDLYRQKKSTGKFRSRNKEVQFVINNIGHLQHVLDESKSDDLQDMWRCCGPSDADSWTDKQKELYAATEDQWTQREQLNTVSRLSVPEFNVPEEKDEQIIDGRAIIIFIVFAIFIAITLFALEIRANADGKLGIAGVLIGLFILGQIIAWAWKTEAPVICVLGPYMLFYWTWNISLLLAKIIPFIEASCGHLCRSVSQSTMAPLEVYANNIIRKLTQTPIKITTWTINNIWNNETHDSVPLCDPVHATIFCGQSTLYAINNDIGLYEHGDTVLLLFEAIQGHLKTTHNNG